MLMRNMYPWTMYHSSTFVCHDTLKHRYYHSIDDSSTVLKIPCLVGDRSCFRSYSLVQVLVFVLVFVLLYDDIERIDLRLFHRPIEQC